MDNRNAVATLHRLGTLIVFKETYILLTQNHGLPSSHGLILVALDEKCTNEICIFVQY